MAIVVNGITCQEIVRNYEESADWDRGPAAVKGFLCPWANRFQVANGLLGLATAASIGGGITLNLPAQHPEIPTIFVRQIAFEPKGPPTQGPRQLQFTNCIVWATYGCIPWSFSGINYGNIDPATPLIYAKQNLNIATETKTVPGQRAFFKTADKATGVDYAFPVTIVEMEVTLMHLPYLPAQQIITISQNPLNSMPFLGCAEGTVYFVGAGSEQSFDTAGTADQNFRMVFKYRPIAPWDQDWSGATWDTVLNKKLSDGGVPFLGRSDLNMLLPTAFSA